MLLPYTSGMALETMKINPERQFDTLDRLVLDNHEKFKTTMGFQLMIIAIHYLKTKNEQGEYKFNSFEEAFLDYTNEPKFSGQYRLILESLAHRECPEELRNHCELRLDEEPEQLSREEKWYLFEKLYQIREIPYTDVQTIEQVLKPLENKYKFKFELIPSAEAFYEMMKRTTNLKQYAA